jgi:hypothetical protein
MVTVVESPKRNSVHYPPDRRFQAWVRRDFPASFCPGLPCSPWWQPGRSGPNPTLLSSGAIRSRLPPEAGIRPVTTLVTCAMSKDASRAYFSYITDEWNRNRPHFHIDEVSLRFEPSGSLGFEPQLLSHRFPVKVVALPADLSALNLIYLGAISKSPDLTGPAP